MTVPELTRELVAIPSHEDETRAGDAIEAWLREETDADVTRDDAGNVIARRRPAGTDGDSDGDDPPTLALVGHHDVVAPDPSQQDDGAYRVEERDGRLYGRGTADMKGAVAAMLAAFRDADPAVELAFASFVGEEVGGEGARHAIDRGFAPEFAVVGEGSTGYSGEGVTDVAVAHKGRRGSTVVARGRAAHASEPGSGENAVYRACDAVEILRGMAAPSTRVEAADRTVTGSLAVTEIEGGSAWNVIPETCEATVDERTVPGERAALERVERIEGVELRVDQDLPPMVCEHRSFVDATLAAADGAQEPAPRAVVKPHATDAGWLAGTGTECVVCGPAEPGEAHTADESVSVDVLERCYRIYRAIAEEFDPD